MENTTTPNPGYVAAARNMAATLPSEILVAMARGIATTIQVQEAAAAGDPEAIRLLRTAPAGMPGAVDNVATLEIFAVELFDRGVISPEAAIESVTRGPAH